MFTNIKGYKLFAKVINRQQIAASMERVMSTYQTALLGISNSGSALFLHFTQVLVFYHYYCLFLYKNKMFTLFSVIIYCMRDP